MNIIFFKQYKQDIHIIPIFYKGIPCSGAFSIKQSERVNSLVCVAVRIKKTKSK